MKLSEVDQQFHLSRQLIESIFIYSCRVTLHTYFTVKQNHRFGMLPNPYRAVVTKTFGNKLPK